MASNKDTLEAQRYNRKRLVTAFVAGTPGGKELAARSPGRPLIVGASLCVVLVIVALVMGRFSPVLRADWKNNTLVVVTGSGARYLAMDGVLHPVTNVTSARLLSESGSFKISEVDASALSGIPRGNAVGLVDAPDQVPSASFLRSGDWVSCSATSAGPRTWVAGAPDQVKAADVAVVTAQGKDYLVADGRRYEMTGSDVAITLNLDAAAKHPVTAAWLSLFQEGTPLRPLTIKNYGQIASGMPSALRDAVIGSLVDVAQDSERRHYVVSDAGQLTPLSELSYQLYLIGSGKQQKAPITVNAADVSTVKVATGVVAPADWPQSAANPVDATQQVCARLAESDRGAATAVAQVPTPVTPFQPGVSVAGGSGALVMGTAGGSLGAVRLVTDQGLAYGLGGNPSDTLGRLGYTESDVHRIPQAWLDLVPSGIELSHAAAWKTVTTP